ncbi:MAG TPA: CPXCG motif-containing cysteine-rich protein [Marinagarivorans sp.]
MLETFKANCPYCGEPIELVIDTSEADQEYIEDCFVCCRPITVTASVDSDGDISVNLRDENS